VRDVLGMTLRTKNGGNEQTLISACVSLAA